MFLLSPELVAQNSENDAADRADHIQQERMQKAAGNVVFDKPSTIERSLLTIDRFIERTSIRYGVNGRGPGYSAGVGIVLERYAAADRIGARVWGTELLHNFYRAGAGLELNNDAARDVSFFVEGSHADSPQLL